MKRCEPCARCAHIADIALLTVDEPEFWEGVTPLTFGSLPRLQDSVAVIGYPIGGDTISVTAGVVSRIEVGRRAGGRERGGVSRGAVQREPDMFRKRSVSS